MLVTTGIGQATDAELAAHAVVGGHPGLISPPQGRLTLTASTPILTAAVAAAANVLYTGYLGNLIPIYDGTNFTMMAFTELTNVLANAATGNAGPAAGAANENYDLFVWNNAGTLTLTRGPVWTNATTRSAGTALVRTNGILLNNASITNGPAASRGTYVGTVRTDSGGATVSWSRGGSAAGGTLATINVWNAYNRVPILGAVLNSDTSWTYSSATIRAVAGSATMRVNLVRGLDEEVSEFHYETSAQLAAASGAAAVVGFGVDATNAFSGPRANVGNNAATAKLEYPSVNYNVLVGLGFHFVSACEQGDGTNTTTYQPVTGRTSFNFKVMA